MFHTRSNGMRVPATVVGFAPDGLLYLEYFQDAVKVVNRQCKVESISFASPSADSPPPSTRSPSPPPDDRGRSPSKSATPSPRAKPRAPKTTKRSREAGKQLAATMKTLKGGLSSVSSEDWKEVLEWLLKRKEDTSKMKWDDAAWHFLPDEEEEDTFLCQVCGKRDTSECSTCDLYLCRGCMDEHTCDIDVPE